MSKDVNCPYCDAELEINHDDGYGYSEGKTYTRECSECEKTFVFTTTITFYHDAEIAPCQNGEPHDYQPIKGVPTEAFFGKKRCSWCGEEIVDQEANEKAIGEYFDKLKQVAK